MVWRISDSQGPSIATSFEQFQVVFAMSRWRSEEVAVGLHVLVDQCTNMLHSRLHTVQGYGQKILPQIA